MAKARLLAGGNISLSFSPPVAWPVLSRPVQFPFPCGRAEPVGAPIPKPNSATTRGHNWLSLPFVSIPSKGAHTGSIDGMGEHSPSNDEWDQAAVRGDSGIRPDPAFLSINAAANQKGSGTWRDAKQGSALHAASKRAADEWLLDFCSERPDAVRLTRSGLEIDNGIRNARPNFGQIPSVVVLWDFGPLELNCSRAVTRLVPRIWFEVRASDFDCTAIVFPKVIQRWVSRRPPGWLPKKRMTNRSSSKFTLRLIWMSVYEIENVADIH